MRQVATPVSGSRSSRLAHPLVPQKRRLVVTAWLRRRIRRTAEARPVTDDVVERVIMVLCFVLSGALSSRECAIGCAAGMRSSGLWPGTALVMVSARWIRERGLGALTRSSRRTGYPDTIAEYRRSVKHPMVLDDRGVDCCVLFTEAWLIRRPAERSHSQPNRAAQFTRAAAATVPSRRIRPDP